MARPSEAERKRERGRTFLRELHGQRFGNPAAEVTADMVGETLGWDPLDTSLTMTWLIGERLVAEVGAPEHGVPDPYTPYPIEVTERGMRFLDTGEIPR